MYRATAIIGAVCLLIVGCVREHAVVSPSPPPDGLTNGRAIFQTGKDANGVQIVAQQPPVYNRCAACHRADGSGGMHLPGGALSADLRRTALVTQMKHPYNLALLERAISTGIDNDGHPLDPVMPRWRLSPRDLHDVSLYVLTLK